MYVPEHWIHAVVNIGVSAQCNRCVLSSLLFITSHLFLSGRYGRSARGHRRRVLIDIRTQQLGVSVAERLVVFGIIYVRPMYDTIHWYGMVYMVL